MCDNDNWCFSGSNKKKGSTKSNIESVQGNVGSMYRDGLMILPNSQSQQERSRASISGSRLGQTETINNISKELKILSQNVGTLIGNLNRLANSELTSASLNNINPQNYSSENGNSVQFPVNSNLSENFPMTNQQNSLATNGLQDAQTNAQQASVINNAIQEFTESLAGMSKDINQIKRQLHNNITLFSEEESLNDLRNSLQRPVQIEEEQEEEKDNSKDPNQQVSHQTNSDQITDQSVTKSEVKNLLIDVNEGDTQQCMEEIANVSSISQRTDISISSQIPITSLIETAYKILKTREKVKKITHLSQEIIIDQWLCLNKEILIIQFKLNGLKYKFYSYIRNRKIGDPYMDELHIKLDKYQKHYKNNEKSDFITKRIKGTDDYLCYVAVVTSHRKE